MNTRRSIPKLTRTSLVMGIIGWVLVGIILLSIQGMEGAKLKIGQSLAAGALFFFMGLAAFILFVVGLVMAFSTSREKPYWINLLAFFVNGVPLFFLMYGLLKAIAGG